MTRDAFLHHFIKVPERPGTHLCVLMFKIMQNKHNIYSTRTERYLWTSRLSIQLYIYTQETGKLKATATTDMFFMINQVILSINDQHISPCKSLLVHPVSTKSIWMNRAFFPLHSHIWYMPVILDGSRWLQFRTLHINTCISLWTVRNYLPATSVRNYRHVR